jgi:hypothetical protein
MRKNGSEFMKRYKRITREMLRQCFGGGAKIRGGWFGAWRVTTDTGGEVVITQKRIRLITGTDDVYRACVLLIGAAWGGATAEHGSREFMLGMAAHGEAWGVPIRPDYTKRGAGAKRFLVALFIVLGGVKIGIAQTDEGMLFTLAVAVAVYFFLRHGAKQEAQKEAEQMGYHYPRVQGTAGAASRDDLQRKGWL